MISEPIITVNCDNEHCNSFIEHQLTALARGAYDDRHLSSQLEAEGWIVEQEGGDEKHYCSKQCWEKIQQNYTEL